MRLQARGYGGFQQLRWRPRGDGFCYALANDVAVCDTESDEPIVRLSHPRPPFSFAFLSQHTVATGGEDKIVRVVRAYMLYVCCVYAVYLLYIHTYIHTHIRTYIHTYVYT